MYRFWEKVDRNGPRHSRLRSRCWVWTAAVFVGSGYGQFQLNGTPRRAHRVSYELIHGPIPRGMCVLHRCDRRACVRPAHLYLGTHADNTRDMIQRKRDVHLRGDRNPSTKLRDRDVSKVCVLHAAGHTMRALAARFGVSASQIHYAVHVRNEILLKLR